MDKKEAYQFALKCTSIDRSDGLKTPYPNPKDFGLEIDKLASQIRKNESKHKTELGQLLLKALDEAD